MLTCNLTYKHNAIESKSTYNKNSIILIYLYPNKIAYEVLPISIIHHNNNNSKKIVGSV